MHGLSLECVLCTKGYTLQGNHPDIISPSIAPKLGVGLCAQLHLFFVFEFHVLYPKPYILSSQLRNCLTFLGKFPSFLVSFLLVPI